MDHRGTRLRLTGAWCTPRGAATAALRLGAAATRVRRGDTVLRDMA